MRKIFVVLGLLVAILCAGCVTSKPAFHSKMPADSVYVDPHNSWANQCPVKSFPSYGKCDSPWRSITVRVVNNKYRDVRVTVKCHSLLGETEFGRQTKVVKKRDDATFLVWGTARTIPDSETVRCKISNVR